MKIFRVIDLYSWRWNLQKSNEYFVLYFREPSSLWQHAGVTELREKYSESFESIVLELETGSRETASPTKAFSSDPSRTRNCGSSTKTQSR